MPGKDVMVSEPTEAMSTDQEMEKGFSTFA